MQESTEIEASFEEEDLHEEVLDIINQFNGDFTVADLVVELLFPFKEDVTQPAEDFLNLSFEAQTSLVSLALKTAIAQTKYERGFVLDGIFSQFLDPQVRNFKRVSISSQHKSVITMIG